jgi:flagellar biosynthetic protein FliP
MSTHINALPRPDIAAAQPHHGGRRGWLPFIGHFVEMVVVMLLGMGVLTAIFGMPHDSSIEVQALYMGATMTVPMAAWMLFRGHSRRGTAEMSAAMFLPLVVLFPMLRAGAVEADALLIVEHALMLPAMLGAMLVRRSDYGL